MDIKEICIKTEAVAAEAANYIMAESQKFNKNFTETKGLNDFVSYVDRGAEKILVEKLGTLLPQSGFMVEEGTSEKHGEKYCWVVDPLDGTTNFIHGVHPFAISIALTENEETIAGVVYEAAGREIFASWRNGGAWLNGVRIHTSKSVKLSDSLIATGFPYRDFSRLPSYFDCLDWMIRNTHGVRRMGSASVDLAYVACGRFDAFFEYGLKPWDVSAGSLILREAGGRVSDFKGSEKDVSGEEIIASNSFIFSDFHEIVSKFMG
jgi:myo-inositol-1(or 4)-monophosphatase